MGACFQTMTLKGDLSTDQVKAKFADAQTRDRYENGHSYSGGFGQARGLKFDNAKFANMKDAHNYLEKTCRKWEEAICVSVRNDQGATCWLIAAWCAE